MVLAPRRSHCRSDEITTNFQTKFPGFNEISFIRGQNERREQAIICMLNFLVFANSYKIDVLTKTTINHNIYLDRKTTNKTVLLK